MSEPLGLIAGEGIFPLLVARGARAAGRSVICCALGGFASDELRGEVDVCASVGLMRLGQWSRVLRKHGVRETIMVGRVPKQAMYAGGAIGRWLQFVPDVRTLRLYVSKIRRDKRDHAVLHAVADALAEDGLMLIDSTRFVKEHMASAGVMTKQSPTERQWSDARYGYHLCRLLSNEDVGQALTLVDRDVIAVEAMEGTDAMIERAGALCRTRGWTFVKVGNAKNDPRFDVPVIGAQTVEKLAKAGCGSIALEAGRVLILDRPSVIGLAERLGISVVGIEGPTVMVAGVASSI